MLFEPHIEPTSQQTLDRGYLLYRDDPDCLRERQFLEELWRLFEPFADPGFRDSIAHDFWPRYWELYLGAALVRHGRPLVRQRTAEGPDFLIRPEGSRQVWIEAVAPGPGTGRDAVPPRHVGGWVPEDKVVLRYTGALHTKAAKLASYRDLGTVGTNEPCVIAINGHDVPFSTTTHDQTVPAIVKALFPFGPWTLWLDRETLKRDREGPIYRPTIEKSHGEEISTSTFLDGAYPHVSAILFSVVDLETLVLCNRANLDQLGAEFSVIHNPHAEAALSPGELGVGREGFFDSGKFRWATPGP